MEPEVVVVAMVPGLFVVAIMALTATGQRRRGVPLLKALVAGVFFPVTWAVWYIRDQRPYRAPGL